MQPRRARGCTLKRYRLARWAIRRGVRKLAKRLGLPLETKALCELAVCVLEDLDFSDLVDKWRKLKEDP